jgi:cytochrome b561
MTQSLGAYLDAVLWIFFGAVILFVAPAMMRKSPRAEQNAKYVPMVRICGILLLLLGLVRLASKMFGWGI